MDLMRYTVAFLALSAIPALVAQNQIQTLPAPASPAVDPNKVIITVGTQKITAGEYDSFVNSLPQQYQSYARGTGKRAFGEQIVQLTLLAEEAEKQKLDQDPKVQKDILFQRENLLAGLMFAQLQKDAKVDDAAIQKYYEEHKVDYDQVTARHILIRVKGAPMQAPAGKPELSDEEALAKAQEARKRVVGGEDFAKVAKELSDDTGSASMGGSLGTFKKGMMVPPFEQAAFAAKIGDISEPVKTPFGYHIIQVQQHESKTLAEAKPEIESKLRPEIARAQVEALRKNVTVDLDDSFFGPAPRTAPTLGAPGAAPAASAAPAAPAPAPAK
jgi:peptidyl-prolyl cis-trans isomerase C